MEPIPKYEDLVNYAEMNIRQRHYKTRKAVSLTTNQFVMINIIYFQGNHLYK
jgi:hypothetical protein